MRVLLHLGQHKTGSKALQSALHANGDFLAAGGFAYPVARGIRPPRPHELGHHALFLSLRSALASGRSGHTAIAGVRARLRRLLSRRASRAGTVILSSEDLFDMHTAHEPGFARELVASGAALLAEALGEFTRDVRLVCYLRRQDHLLAAHYAQFIKGSGRNDLDFAEFRRRFEARLDSEAILAPWESAFGVDRVTVVPYERHAMPGGIVGDFFGRVLRLGLPPRPEPFPHDPEAFNVTPSREQVEFIRCLNRRSARGKRVLSRSQVLGAAFQGRRDAPTGIAAWLSPGDRAELLSRHEPGNRKIAQRHGLGDTLFREPAPGTADGGSPSPPPDLPSLVELDSRARRFTSRLPPWRRLLVDLRHRLLARQALWIVPPAVESADRALATRLFAGIAGSPDLETRIAPSLGDLAPPRGRRRVALVVLVGPVAADAGTATALGGLRNPRAPVVLVLGDLPAADSRLAAVRSLAPGLDAVICATRLVRDALLRAVPEFGSIPVHPLAGEEPRPEALEAIARV